MAIQNDAEPVTLNIELKKLTGLLNAEAIGSRGCTAHFIREKILHLSLIRDDVTLEYYLPGILTGLSGEYAMNWFIPWNSKFHIFLAFITTCVITKFPLTF